MHARLPRAALGDGSVARRGVWGNSLTGAVPPELGKLTDLEELCAAPRRLRVGDGRTRRARSVCVWLRSSLSSNGFSGTLGSWVGSLAKLRKLYAPARAHSDAREHAGAQPPGTIARAPRAHTVRVRVCVPVSVVSRRA